MYKQLSIDEPMRMSRNKSLSFHRVPGPCLGLWIERSRECCLRVVTISWRRNMCRMKQISSLNQLWEEQEQYPKNGWLTNKDDPGQPALQAHGKRQSSGLWKWWASTEQLKEQAKQQVNDEHANRRTPYNRESDVLGVCVLHAIQLKEWNCIWDRAASRKHWASSSTLPMSNRRAFWDRESNVLNVLPTGGATGWATMWEGVGRGEHWALSSALPAMSMQTAVLVWTVRMMCWMYESCQ
jgi:hypothetical protein